MRKFVKAAVLGATIAAAGAPAAMADGAVKQTINKVNGTTQALNSQINMGDIYSNLQVKTQDAGEVAGTSAAIANSLSATTSGALSVVTGQANSGNVNAGLNATIDDVSKSASLTAAGIGNSVSLTVDGANKSLNAATGQLNTGGVGAVANVVSNKVNGKLEVTSAAIGNSASIVNKIVE